MDIKQYTNSLIGETSPYLLQHANHPVDWHPWSETIIDQAKTENKLLLISIGYSACHWCHVMAHESFEDPEVASVMNRHFICIKVDREERPDIDHYYLTAVQLTGKQGGWPLNVIALPDGRMVWGGTYFPRELWIRNIRAVAEYFQNNQAHLYEYAERLSQGISQTFLEITETSPVPASGTIIRNAVHRWKKYFDPVHGGNTGSPKFPMPVNLRFLLHYGSVKNDREILDFVRLTLTKIAFGGIYDHAGGGFARYSTDEIWKVPHFEKMLYDNAQLLSLYAEASMFFREPEFKKIIIETSEFLERELLSEEGGFWSSYDADSEGEEGRYYLWKKEEINEITGTDFELFTDYFSINETGYWEDGNYILYRITADETFASANGIPLNDLEEKIRRWKQNLRTKRERRPKPALDNKILTSWNAMTVQGLVDAYRATGIRHFLNLAKRTAIFMKEKLFVSDDSLLHQYNPGHRSQEGFLDDYAFVIQSFVSMFEVTGEETWLERAMSLTSRCFSDFYNSGDNLFYYSHKNSNSMIMNHYPAEDNVIASGNSVLAACLFRVSVLTGKEELMVTAKRMLQVITPRFSEYPSAYAGWGRLMLMTTEPSGEIVICGPDAEKVTGILQGKYLPQVTWAFSTGKSSLPIFMNRMVDNKTLIYVCQNQTCMLPVEEPEEALKLLGSLSNGSS